ncbi:hypothetical protein PCANC_13527 [Puccinia coronata f. sp. avenae]|uniref:Uncharacterized protein n=1 Tax=Puccinia coronata f. sp. avenae TaxID=200324 RepID=A0A2N5USR1_9BASI|nr:hypothetical protein PCANC_13527 [Puccinia coronata f. sp. avenae]
MIPKPSLTLEDLEILHQLQDDSPQIRAEKTSRLNSRRCDLIARINYNGPRR